jgi:uncharacterized membrane protein
MASQRGFTDRLRPTDRQVNRWIAGLFGAVYAFVGAGMVMGFGTVFHRGAYYVMVGFFAAAILTVLLTVPLFYLTRIERRTSRRSRP